MTLYELTEAYIELRDKKDDESVKLCNEYRKSIYKKIEGYGRAILSLDGDLKKQEEEIAVLNKKKQITKEKKEAARKAILETMLAIDCKKIHTAFFDFSVRPSADVLVIDNEDNIPAEFFKPQPDKLDKTKLNKWAKNNTSKIESFGHYEPVNNLTVK